MVTHDPGYAEHAERSIHLFDGRIVEDVSGPLKETLTAQLEKRGFEVS